MNLLRVRAKVLTNRLSALNLTKIFNWSRTGVELRCSITIWHFSHVKARERHAEIYNAVDGHWSTALILKNYVAISRLSKNSSSKWPMQFSVSESSQSHLHSKSRRAMSDLAFTPPTRNHQVATSFPSQISCASPTPSSDTGNVWQEIMFLGSAPTAPSPFSLTSPVTSKPNDMEPPCNSIPIVLASPAQIAASRNRRHLAANFLRSISLEARKSIDEIPTGGEETTGAAELKPFAVHAAEIQSSTHSLASTKSSSRVFVTGPKVDDCFKPTK